MRSSAATGDPVDLVSGGNSANLDWALGATDLGRVNDLRLGEAILLGREPLHRRPIDRLHTDAFTLVGEVIEAKVKPSLPWGDIGQTAFGVAPPVRDRGPVQQAILALGVQDVDSRGSSPPTASTSSAPAATTSSSTPAIGRSRWATRSASRSTTAPCSGP